MPHRIDQCLHFQCLTAFLAHDDFRMAFQESRYQFPWQQFPEQNLDCLAHRFSGASLVRQNLTPQVRHPSSELLLSHAGLQVHDQPDLAAVHQRLHRVPAHRKSRRPLDSAIGKVNVALHFLNLGAIRFQMQTNVFQ